MLSFIPLHSSSWQRSHGGWSSSVLKARAEVRDCLTCCQRMKQSSELKPKVNTTPKTHPSDPLLSRGTPCPKVLQLFQTPPAARTKFSHTSLEGRWKDRWIREDGLHIPSLTRWKTPTCIFLVVGWESLRREQLKQTNKKKQSTIKFPLGILAHLSNNLSKKTKYHMTTRVALLQRLAATEHLKENRHKN